ncbi:hypothetical protein GJAV_G00090270 [Gymnothorax javanicus]|nr:hypothetical protein GJAV_G00090270 [Gymnothorax javanicus]
MDMRFYSPPVQPPSATDPSCPDPSRRFDPLCCNNKLVQESMYMSASELIQDFSPVSQVCPVSGLGDEDLGIPLIAPSTLPDSPYPPASDGGAYHSHLPPRAQSRHNGLHPFNSLTMDSPGLNISSTFSQNGDPAPSFLSAQMDDFRPSIQSVMVQQGQLTTINQSQLSPHLELSGRKVPHDSPSPPGSKRASLSPLSSIHEDESEEAPKVNIGYLGTRTDCVMLPR